MSLLANSLATNIEQKNHIDRLSKHILAKIDEELKQAHETGKRCISTTVPITFSIPYMKNSDAQREIYHAILQSLLKRKFNPKIELKKDCTIFYITWLSQDELKDIDIKNKLLAKYTS